MAAAANMVQLAALVGNTARATILSALMGGQALTAGELAARANFQIHCQRTYDEAGRRPAARGDTETPQPLLSHRSQWPRCWKASWPLLPLKPRPAISHVRTKMTDYVRRAPCYHHLAGQLGVTIADADDSKRIYRSIR